VIAGVLVVGVIYVMLGQYAFTGHAGARLVTLTLSVVGILSALLQGPADPTGLLFRIWILNLALDVAILLTLSAGDVREFDTRSAYRRARDAVRAAGAR
jgi:hypothetical protein